MPLILKPFLLPENGEYFLEHQHISFSTQQCRHGDVTLDSSQDVDISRYGYSSWSCWLNQSHDIKSYRNVIT